MLTGREQFTRHQGQRAVTAGRTLLAMEPEMRAREGVFLSFQYPVEIPGVSTAYFLKAAVNAVRKHRGDRELDAIDFLKIAREKAKIVGMDESFLNRSLNEGFSGGEKKRNEIFQMLMLEPTLAVLDETDSGLDVDALRTVARRRQRACARPIARCSSSRTTSGCSNYIVPDRTHVLAGGRIVRSGGPELALRGRGERLRVDRGARA